MLIEDHRKVQKMFKRAEKLGDEDTEALQQLVEKACAELTLHAQIEEELFYPPVREATGDEDLMDEAQVEHECAKDLIAQLQGMRAGDDLYAAKFKVLGEYVNHHIEEEEGEMFKKAKRAKVDFAEIGQQILERKGQAQGQMGTQAQQREDSMDSDVRQ